MKSALKKNIITAIKLQKEATKILVSTFVDVEEAEEREIEALQVYMQNKLAERKHTNIDNLIVKKKQCKEAAKEENMPPKYKDGSFRYKKSGLLEYRFIHDGKRYSVYGNTHQECYNKRTSTIKKDSQQKSGHKYTLAAWLEAFFKIYKTRKDGTTINSCNLNYIEIVKNSPVGNIMIDKLKGVHLQEFLGNFSDTPNTQNKIRTFINAALEKAVDNQYITFNPCRAVELERHTATSYSVIQPIDHARIIDAISEPKYLAFFHYCMCTGMRISEALGSLDSIDLEKRTISVCGKDTKTKKHTRKIPFLLELFPAGRIELLKQIGKSGVEIYFRKLFKELDIDAVIHSMRHTFASCCYRVGFKDKQIQTWLGHSSIKMTLDTYTHILDNANSPIIDYLGRLKDSLEL